MTKPKSIVVAGHRLTAEAAAEILAEGGNAFDAAVAGVLAACVAEPVFASLGGGGFLMAHEADRGHTTLFDFFPDTPRAKRPAGDLDFRSIEANFGPAKQEFHIGAAAATAPTVPAGLFAIHAALCRMPMRRLTEPAARLAREGVRVCAFQAYLFTIIAPILTASEGARALFAPNGKLLAAGDRYLNPTFAETLEWMAEDGPRLFTEGDAAAAILAQSRELGGYLTARDLAEYRVELRRPLHTRRSGADIWLNPPPAASGVLIAYALRTLDDLLTSATLDALAIARVMQATNAARAAYGDRLERMPGAEPPPEAAEAPSAYRGTTHLSVIDRRGNAAAVSISNGEGNGLMVGGFGFMLNNMLGEEDLNAGGFHAWKPGVRLSSMMAPTLIRDADGALTALGSGGSNRIRSAILQVASNLLDRRMGLAEAVEAPRLHLEKSGTLSFEDGFNAESHEALLAAFPEAEIWPEPNLFFGGVHAARRFADGRVEGASDPRRQGVAVVV